MKPPNPEPCELLPWDTEFFGFRIGRVRGNALDADLAAQVDDWSRRERIRALYFLARGDAPAATLAAEEHGFGLVDVRLTLGQSLREPAREVFETTGADIRAAQPGDVPGLEKIARTSHRDTRFFSDPHFSREQAEELYARWISLEATGRARIVLVAAMPDGEPGGYISCHWDPADEEAQIGLLGVAAPARGRGLGKALVLAAVKWCRDQGVPQITVVTQGKNVAAQRLYQRCGFQTRDFQFWFHKWYSVDQV